jgi:hypothetical protein
MLFSSKRQSKTVLHHSYTPLDKFQFSTQEFYAEIEKELIARQVPGLTISRVDFHEGGLFSDKRTYLRLSRERLAFDICAAPFGRTFFFSLRIVEKPRLGWLVVILFFAALGAFYLAYLRAGDSALTIAGLVAIAAFIYWIFRPPPVTTTSLANADAKSQANSREVPTFSTFLLNLPVIGPWYERIRKDSYYRLDTRMMYLTVVKEIVQKKIDLITAVKGVKLMRRHEYDPILGALYKKVPIRPGEENPNE